MPSTTRVVESALFDWSRSSSCLRTLWVTASTTWLACIKATHLNIKTVLALPWHAHYIDNLSDSKKCYVAHVIYNWPVDEWKHLRYPSPEATLSFPICITAQIENILFRQRMKALEQPRHGFRIEENEPLVIAITYNNLHLQCPLVQTGCIWYAEIWQTGAKLPFII